MENNPYIDAIILFLGFIVFTVLHEYAHAWTAVRCGDDTPRMQGRLTLDPLAHIEWLGTVLLPLVLLLSSAASGQVWLMGWGRPVQVNLNNFRYRRRDDIIVSAAGPAMNFVIAVVLLLLAKASQLAGYRDGVVVSLYLARFSLFLCFFNLLPIPPLDGGHIMRNMIGMSDDAYAAMSRYSFLFFLIIMRVPQIGQFLEVYTTCVLAMLAWPLGWNLLG